MHEDKIIYRRDNTLDLVSESSRVGCSERAMKEIRLQFMSFSPMGYYYNSINSIPINPVPDSGHATFYCHHDVLRMLIF